MAHQAGSDAENAQFYDFEMRLCPTSLDRLTTNFEENYDGNEPVIVSTADPLIITADADEWIPAPGFGSFDYSGDENLIIELRWQGDNGGDAFTWADPNGVDRTLLTDDVDSETGMLNAVRHRFRITLSQPDVQPVSWGVIKARF